MIDEFLKKYDFNEMTKYEVTKLLGTPPETNYFKENYNIVYYLCDERRLNDMLCAVIRKNTFI